MGIHTHIQTMDTAGYLVAVAHAERRALHSYFDQHVIEDDGRYYAHDEGDYNALPADLANRVMYTVPGGLADEY